MALKKTTAQEALLQEKPESELRSIWESLKLSKTAVIGMVIIIILILIALVTFITEKAGIQILPYDPNEADMSASFVAPCAEHWFGTDELGRDIFSRILDGTKISLFVGFSVVIFSMFFGIILGAVAGYKGGVIDTVIMRLMDIMLSIPGILFAITLMAALGKGLDKAIIAIGIVSIPEYARIVRGSVLQAKESDYTQAAPLYPVAPCAEHWFGTDELGRDIFSRILDGTKISLFVGFSVVIFSMFFGIILGAVAGYKGGVIDTVIMRLMDIMLSIPGILFAITLMAALGKGLDKAIIAIGIVSIPEYARIVRGSVLQAKESDYTQAARVIGNKDIRIIFNHILPNVISPIIVRATLGISGAILDTAALGFLGLGVQPPLAEWGDMLGRAKGYIFSAPYTLVFPGLAITLAVLAFNLFGDGLSDALDPKSRKR